MIMGEEEEGGGGGGDLFIMVLPCVVLLHGTLILRLLLP